MSELQHSKADGDLPEWAEKKLQIIRSKDLWGEGKFMSHPRDVERAKQVIDELASGGVRLGPVSRWLREAGCADRDYKTFMDYAKPRLR